MEELMSKIFHDEFGGSTLSNFLFDLRIINKTLYTSELENYIKYLKEFHEDCANHLDKTRFLILEIEVIKLNIINKHCTI